MTNALFDREVATEILNMQLLDSSEPDLLIWAPDRRGHYSVHTAYRLCDEVLAIEAPSLAHFDWNVIWRMEVPPKVTDFLWRSCRQCLTTKTRLREKGWFVPTFVWFVTGSARQFGTL